MQSHFSALLRKINISYLLWKLKIPKSIWWNFPQTKKIELCKIIVVKKHEIHEITFLDYFSFQIWKKFNGSGEAWSFRIKFLPNIALLSAQFFLFLSSFILILIRLGRRNFGDFSWNLSGIIILIFFQNSNWFLKCQHIFTTRWGFFCMSFVGIVNISLSNLR